MKVGLFAVWIVIIVAVMVESMRTPAVKDDEQQKPKVSIKPDFDEVVIHKPMVFDIAFKKGDTIGTMRMDDEEFEVYIGHGEIGCVDGAQKRKFTIIEV